MNELPKFKSGNTLTDEVSSERMNAIVDAIRENSPLPGYGVRLTKSGAGTTIAAIRKRHRETIPPFHVELFSYGSDDYPTFRVTVNRGWVREMIPATGDCLAPFIPSNIYDGENLRKFDISPTQAVYVVCEITPAGLIGGTAPVCRIVVSADNAASTHYVPTVGDMDGGASYASAGQLWFKLAVLDATGHVVPWLMDSHLSHWVDVPSFAKGGGDHDIFCKYDIAAQQYITNGLSADDATGHTGVSIRRDGRNLKFGLDPAVVPNFGSAPNFNLRALQVTLSGTITGGIVVTDAADPSPVLYVRKGAFAPSDADAVDTYYYVAQIYSGGTESRTPFVAH